jgi:hypothetical protein
MEVLTLLSSVSAPDFFFRIRIQHFRLNTNPDLIPDTDPGFSMTKNVKNLQLKIFLKFFDQKLKFTYSLSSIKDFQATGEAFSPQNTTSSTSKHEIS